MTLLIKDRQTKTRKDDIFTYQKGKDRKMWF